MTWMDKVSKTSGKIPSDTVVLGWNEHNGFFFASISYMKDGDEWGWCWNMHESAYGVDEEPAEWIKEDDWPTHWCELVKPIT